MDKLKRYKGITLISLIITIIILIILAGISISMILGNEGLLNKANYAKESYSNAQQQEELEIAKYSNIIDEHVDSSRENVEIDSEIYNRLKSSISLDGSVFINRPDTWNTGIEYSWKDGENIIYGKKFTGTTTSNTDIGVISGARLISNYNIQVYKEGIQGPVSSGFWSTSNYISGLYYSNTSDDVIHFAVSSNYTNLNYEVWVLYVK